MGRHVLLLLIAILGFQSASAQLFSRERLANLETFDKQFLTWGYFLGVNFYDYTIDYEELQPDITVGTSPGFSVGLIGDMRLNQYLNLRLEPGLYITNRTLTYPRIADEAGRTREVGGTFIHVPLLLKVSTKRVNNWKPFVVGGVSYSHNLSSNEDNPDDNSAGQFRVLTNTYNYEIGFGIDLYLFYFKFTPSIRGVFAFNDELVPDADPNSPWTGNIAGLKTRGVFLNFTFQ